MTVYVGDENPNWFGGGDDPDTAQGGGGDDELWGEAGDDRLYGEAGDDTVLGGTGDDKVFGGDGADALYGDQGSDTLNGGAGADRISAIDFSPVPDHDVVIGGAGDDDIRAGPGDRLDGGGGQDTVELNFDGPHAIRADLRVMDAGETAVFSDGSELASIEGGFIDFGSGSDRLKLGDDAFHMFGREGDDRLVGGAGDDFAEGDQGADTLVGGGGDDELHGDFGPGDGIDLIKGGAGDDSLSGDSGDTILGGGGVDILSFGFGPVAFDVEIDFNALSRGAATFADGTVLAGLEGGFIGLGAGDDRVAGADEAVRIFGGDGNDQLGGGGGDDLLSGDLGRNSLAGGGGADVLASSGEGDELTGGDGVDVFQIYDAPRFGVVHRITDLAADEVVSLTGVDANANVAFDQDFFRVDKFTGNAGQASVRYDRASDTTRVEMDMNGDKTADLTLLIDGDHRDFAGFVW